MYIYTRFFIMYIYMMYMNCIYDAYSSQATPWPDFRHSGLHQATLKSESATQVCRC